jgi:cobalamin biosynthesis protein CobW
VTVENKPMRLAVQGVGPRVDSYFDRPLREEERGSGHLVIIGLKGLDRQRVAARLGGSIS